MFVPPNILNDRLPSSEVDEGQALKEANDKKSDFEKHTLFFFFSTSLYVIPDPEASISAG